MGRKISNTARVALSLTVAPALLLAAACSSEPEDVGEDMVPYCVDKDGKVIDDATCDQYEQQHAATSGGGVTDNTLFWIMLLNMNQPHYAPGMVIPAPANGQPAYTRVPANNPAAREAAGLPRSGKISSGTKISGIGRGSAGGKAGSSGGSGGGAKGGSGSSGS